MAKKDLVYLAGPYSHPDQKVMEDRELAHSRLAAILLSHGEHIYCPIAETCNIAKHDSVNDTGWDFWRDKDLNQLSRCDKIYVMLLDGWKESKGTRGEVKFALKNNIPIEFVAVDGSYTVITDVLQMFGVESVDDLND